MDTLDAAAARIAALNLAVADQTPGAARRAEHPRQQGCARAVFTVLETAPEDLRVGLFTRPGVYQAVVRSSRARSLDDRGGDVSGLAIKLLDAPQGVQDFILIDSEIFLTGDVDDYLRLSRGLLDKTLSLTRRLGLFLRLALRRPGLLLRLLRVSQPPDRSPLARTYFSATPYALGSRAVKYVLRPLGSPPPAPGSGPTALAAALAAGPAAFDFGLDVQTDPLRQPIEDPTRPWSAAPGARRVWLGRLDIPAQDIGASAALGENLAFSPWNAGPEHQPLGAINAVRREVYRQSSLRRRTLNGVTPPDTPGLPLDAGPDAH